jgi:hypothetical protein
MDAPPRVACLDTRHPRRLLASEQVLMRFSIYDRTSTSCGDIFFRETDDFEGSFQVLIDALDTDLDWVHAHTRLLTRAIEWDNNGRDNSFLLRGNDLRAAEEWQVRAANKEPKLTALQTEYMLASRRDATRRQRLMFIAVTLGLVVAVVLGSIAWWQRNVAVEQEKIASARLLAAQAELATRQEGDLLQRGVLLAIEAMRRLPSPSPETDQILRTGLGLLPRPVAPYHTTKR